MLRAFSRAAMTFEIQYLGAMLRENLVYRLHP